MYVNYYDHYVKQDFEKPTIGILLCESKKDSLVELTLPKDANIYATAYQLYLPDKALRWRLRIKVTSECHVPVLTQCFFYSNSLFFQKFLYFCHRNMNTQYENN